MTTRTPETVYFEPDRTALLVIDPVNEFLHEDGAAWEMTKSTVHKKRAVTHDRRAPDRMIRGSQPAAEATPGSGSGGLRG
jgi:isochorismate hydrolase